jgi:transposase-like protein
MQGILAGINSLIQYKYTQEYTPERVRPECCACCGRLKPWYHAFYERKSDRENPPDKSMNPIIIQRYYCPGCKKTFSVLPECIPPRRWYLWDVQQTILLLSILSKSAYAIAKESAPSYKTIRRWLACFQEQFLLHKDTLATYFNELSRTSGISEFWQFCLNKMTLGAAMRLCHVSGVAIP